MKIMSRILIRTKEKTFFVGLEDVLYCKAAGAYSIIYLVGDKEIVTSINLLKLQERMQCWASIFRVSQSYLVNLLAVRSINHGKKELELENSNLIPFTVSVREIEKIFISIDLN